MKKITSIFLLFAVVTLQAQMPRDSTIIDVLKRIEDFNTLEKRMDSLLNRPLGRNTEGDILQRYKFADTIYRILNKLDKNSLLPDDQVNLELLKYEIEDDLSTFEYKSYLNPILSDAGFHTGLASMGSQVLSTKKEAENYIKRLKDIPRFINEHIVLMRKGLQLGICQPRSILNGYENTYEQHIVTDPTTSVFYKPFSRKPFAISEEDWKTICEEGKTVVKQYAIEGFKTLKFFFDQEYLPKTTTKIGASHFPNGLAYYQERTKHYTTTDLSYEQVYQLGLKEVARIKTEMQQVLIDVDFKGSMKEFITFLRTDPKFYATTPEQLLKEASFIAKKADGMLPMLFGKLPRQPYTVEPVPGHLAPTYTAGRYSGAPVNSKRAGAYWVNTYDLKSRSLYNLEALTLHEAVPGHHLQIALTKEMTELPPFRRNLYVNTFGEGWGLYCEFLGTEMGFYKDPYSRFGRLTYEMWRACRLVLDVALHTKGWTREQGVAYLAEHTALSLHEVNTEINRYISWPGQALAYKMGELKIKELRKRAEEKLKDKFDVRAFHDLVLSQGSVTLKILEGMVDKWIMEKM